jgi:hypothetical protein
MIKVSPLKVDGWLAQLEEIARSGDLEGLMGRFQALRGELHGDVEVQRAANIGPRPSPLRKGDADGDGVHPHPGPLPQGEEAKEEG